MIQFVPCRNIHEIRIFLGPEQTHAVRRAGIARRECQENPVFTFQKCGAFIDPEAMPLPGIARCRQEHLRCLQCQRILHAGNIQIGDFFSKNKDDFDIFSKSRHSMRLYDSSGLQIERDVLEKCIRSSMNAPSACNRQAVRILVVDNKKIIKKISEIQKGATGFGENSSALILVLSDIRYYVTAERRLPMFDCGLFSMNLLYNFHYNGLGACILNGSFTEEQEKDLMNIIDIPDYEMLACVIAVSKINHNETIRIAKSARRNAKDIYRFIEG